ncbi:MAG: hypothetical protein HKP14_03135, partial [Bacteroidia bacterium]|nr:hypothetical protein [Bacteroidia bacterium]
MIKLIQNGLFADNLFAVNNPLIVKRYNNCLIDIGLTPTKLKSFHIDGWGWSPEIAEEQGNRTYLCHGLANPFGIIISPEQEFGPIYMPFHTFDSQIHKLIFKLYKEQIADITAVCGLWFELDQEVTAFRSPQDLLMIDYITVVFYSVDRIMKAAQEQRALIREFYDVPQAWSNQKLRNDIIESSKKHGDLRFKKFEIPNTPFVDIENYYTLAFNGLYVFKNLNSDKPLLVFSNKESAVSGESTHGHIEFNIGDHQLLSYLYNNNIISNDLEIYKSHPILVELIKDFILLRTVNGFDKTIQYHALNKTQKKGVINKLLSEHIMPEEYFELEKLLSILKDDKAIQSYSVSDKLRPYLLHPHSDLKENQKKVVWQLLCTINNHNPLTLYLFNKSLFYSMYGEWEEQTQIWVVDKLLEHKNIYN